MKTGRIIRSVLFTVITLIAVIGFLFFALAARNRIARGISSGMTICLAMSVVFAVVTVVMLVLTIKSYKSCSAENIQAGLEQRAAKQEAKDMARQEAFEKRQAENVARRLRCHMLWLSQSASRHQSHN